MQKKMSNKIALVTGASSGIGKAAALAFAKNGANVVLASRNLQTGEAAAEEVRKLGGEALFIQTDVTQPQEVEKLVSKTVERFGRLDYAFNNAGSGGRGDWLAAMDADEWDKTIKGFLKSTFLCMKYELEQMMKQGSGAIVNNSSVDGKRAFGWDPAYSAAKHGVLGLTKSAAMQYAEKNIRINAVCPGWVLTPPVEEALRQDPNAEQGMLLHQPIRRFGKPEEIAQAVVWLCSDEASFVLGTALDVDGGYLMV